MRLAYPKYAAIFLLVGLLVALGVWLLMTTRSGLGTGASAGGDTDEPVALVWLYASYFFCGATASCMTNRKARAGAAVIAHTLPFLGIAFANSDQSRILAGIILGTFVIFGLAWLDMLVSMEWLRKL